MEEVKIEEKVEEKVEEIEIDEQDTEVINVKAVLDSIEDFNPKEMGLSDIPRIVIAVMEIVEKIQGMSGNEKKELVVKTVTQIVDDSDLAGSFEEFILPMIPSLLDKFVEADKGKLKLNKNFKSGFLGLFSCFCCKKK